MMPEATMTQLRKLATPVPDHLIERNAKGLAYVAHEVITQWLLYVIGPFDFELVELHRGDVLSRESGKFTDDGSKVLLRNVVIGATYRLTCEIDGRRTVIEQTGDVEQPTNWQHDGARIKDAESDAIKRCAMRVGAALHLWAGDEYFLDRWLDRRDGVAPDPPPADEPEAKPARQRRRGQGQGQTKGKRQAKTEPPAADEPSAEQPISDVVAADMVDVKALIHACGMTPEQVLGLARGLDPQLAGITLGQLLNPKPDGLKIIRGLLREHAPNPAPLDTRPPARPRPPTP